MLSVDKFYDEFTVQQLKAGIHHRHLSIQRWLEQFGLTPHSRVLEIGCGIGTQTELILRFLKKGHVTSLDISPKSIQLANEKLAKYQNKTLLVGNVTHMELEGSYDIILLPDVLEHIPISEHEMLFIKLEKLLSTDGTMIIHIPDPDALRWIHENRKEELQIIDQPIDTLKLLESMKPTNFKLEFLKSYSIFKKDPDYQILIFKKDTMDRKYSELDKYPNDSIFRRIKRKVKYISRGNK